jgi:hypothetical protein
MRFTWPIKLLIVAACLLASMAMYRLSTASAAGMMGGSKTGAFAPANAGGGLNGSGPAPAVKAPPSEEEIRFVNTLQKTVNRTSSPLVAEWDAEGGLGSMRIFNGVALIAQTPEGHRKVAEFLQALQRTGTVKNDSAQALPRESELLAKTRRQLAQKIDLDASKTPLPDVLDEVRQKAAINLVIDRAVPDSGFILSSFKVDAKAAQKPVESVLGEILPAEFGYTVEEGFALVTTRQKIERKLPIGLYRVWAKDGQPMGLPPKGAPLGEELLTVVRRFVNNAHDLRVAPWEEEGGTAQAKILNDTLVATQSPAGHEQVAALLGRLAEKGALGAGSGQAFAAKPEAPETVAIRRTLAELVDVDFQEMSRANIVEHLAKLKPALALRVDPKVAANGFDMNSWKETFKLKQMSVEAILALALGDDLTFTITPDGVRVLPRKILQQDLTTVVYKIAAP